MTADLCEEEKTQALSASDDLPLIDATIELPVNELILTGSPRLRGESSDHVHTLAEVDAVLPPILVHRPSMRVIDGVHRVRAALMRGETMIRATLYDGTDDDAFVLAVQLNNSHGLPLSLADRKSAAQRILRAFPERSDRSIAATVGLSHRTVGRIRWCSGGENIQPNTRLGQDGKTHTLTADVGRRRVGELIARNPEASIRQVAQAAGVSVGTAHDVRQRMRRGEDPVPARTSSQPNRVSAKPCGDLATSRLEPDSRALGTLLDILRTDPSLRFTDAGRDLLRRLASQPMEEREWIALADGVPQHCARLIAELAEAIARDWSKFAERVNKA
ncbi:ParB/RepB/Spo0J family partition protein [Nocardia yamanashiensis]|uniref:ParB/RepB/Spo0J family partition protein n=1 Tax=Nocardia yamanashiensis TaxID=209247 RepID=UPI001C3FE11D|nr:ParB/RepB/Spo0J family partition protein [Nocardia yamanashiensis]